MIKGKNTYSVGIYARISKDNGCTKISESIENQKESLRRYAEGRHWPVIKYYVDRGHSGTNFERPALQEMLADAKEGLIDLILVKDLSRIGRNHLLVGALIETILPEMDCRFIALNNHIDTLDHDSPHMDYVGFINLFNENYSRQTSRKVKSIRKSLAEQGKFLGTYAPYGYLKNPENKHQLIPDPETASIIRRIFHMRCVDNSFRSIAATLNQEGILSPRTLYYQRKGTDNSNHEILSLTDKAFSLVW